MTSPKNAKILPPPNKIASSSNSLHAPTAHAHTLDSLVRSEEPPADPKSPRVPPMPRRLLSSSEPMLGPVVAWPNRKGLNVQRDQWKKCTHHHRLFYLYVIMSNHWKKITQLFMHVAWIDWLVSSVHLWRQRFVMRTLLSLLALLGTPSLADLTVTGLPSCPCASDAQCTVLQP